MGGGGGSSGGRSGGAGSAGGRYGNYDLVYMDEGQQYELWKDPSAAEADGTWDVYRYSNGNDEIEIRSYHEPDSGHPITPDDYMRVYEKMPDQLKEIIDHVTIGGPGEEGHPNYAGWYNSARPNGYYLAANSKDEGQWFFEQCIVHEATHALQDENLEFQLNIANIHQYRDLQKADTRDGRPYFNRGDRSYVSSYGIEAGPKEDQAEMVAQYITGTARDASFVVGHKSDFAERYPNRNRALNKFFGLDRQSGDKAMWDQIKAKAKGTPTSNLPHAKK